MFCREAFDRFSISLFCIQTYRKSLSCYPECRRLTSWPLGIWEIGNCASVREQVAENRWLSAATQFDLAPSRISLDSLSLDWERRGQDWPLVFENNLRYWTVTWTEGFQRAQIVGFVEVILLRNVHIQVGDRYNLEWKQCDQEWPREETHVSWKWKGWTYLVFDREVD